MLLNDSLSLSRYIPEQMVAKPYYDEEEVIYSEDDDDDDEILMVNKS